MVEGLIAMPNVTFEVRAVPGDRSLLATVRLPRSAGWLCLGLGGAMVLSGMALEAHNPGGLVLAAFGLILIGACYLLRQALAVSAGDPRIVRLSAAGDIWLADDWQDPPSGHGRHDTLLLLAAALWCALTLVTAVAAMAWGDLAGLATACAGGIMAVVLLLGARRHLC